MISDGVTFSKSTAALRKHFSLDKVCGWLFQNHLSLDNLAIKSRIAAINDPSSCCIGRHLGSHLSIYVLGTDQQEQVLCAEDLKQIQASAHKFFHAEML